MYIRNICLILFSIWPFRVLEHRSRLYARYLCSRDALGLKAGRPSAARDDRVSCIQRSRVKND